MATARREYPGGLAFAVAIAVVFVVTRQTWRDDSSGAFLAPPTTSLARADFITTEGVQSGAGSQSRSAGTEQFIPVGVAAAAFFVAVRGSARAVQSTARRAEEEKKSLSDDGFIAPRTAAEEKQMLKTIGQKGFWRSEFDDLPVEEKLTAPGSIIALASVIIPCVLGAYLLVTSSD
mmetsp:Transcript_20797/g.45813  ORF Transcript_20797/g.45813 Transcript_20797/m.45813 type:complete len:176 (-) Transcript_20797:187-714(-)|eukprot:CAMPEP_0170600040 /NCGR_PEP_ID=MMETSP0224-20130122/17126_1 /TAXON_ID=285029 /ORGANISM="Togula jolla, Strain CCCM 725" /LENGTH=175 /DNA_ID=CAMNT_0010924747 /DNA_START=54 /DNA_END=581 /DNA_ORIENTATION=+